MTVSQNCPCAPYGTQHKLVYIAGSATCAYCKQKIEGCCEGQPPDVAIRDAHGVKRP